jgi:hypothetical protein
VILTGAEEVPPVGSDAAGKFTATVSGNTLTYHLQVTGTGLTMAHLHLGAKGTNGPVVVPLFNNATGVNAIDVSGTMTVNDLIGPLQGDIAGFMAALRAGNIYVNAHSLAHPAGVIRAQIPPVAIPTAPSTGTGTAATTGTNGFTLGLVLACAALLVTGGATGAVVARRRHR